jgi:phosphodiesterase/alkaline phosphatase D-like protein
MKGPLMTTLHTKPAIAAALAGLLLSSSGAAQVKAYVAKEQPPAVTAPRVHIARGPALESADENSAIIRWTSNNPGGSDEHFGVVHYGTSPKEVNQTAKSHIRLNQKHAETVFRVSVEGLAPRTTYYYTVDSMQANGKSDGVKSTLEKFTTPGPGKRIMTSVVYD